MVMRGFSYVGRVSGAEYVGWSRQLAIVGDLRIVQKGDILQVAAGRNGPLRPGSMRVVHVGLLDDIVILDDAYRALIPGIAESDHVFVARALGENALGTRKAK